MKRVLTLFVLAASLALLGCPRAEAAGLHFKLLKIIHLPTTDGGGDAVGYDAGSRDIYVSMGKTDSGGVVIDADNDSLVKVIRNGIVRPSGMAWDRGYVYWTSDLHLKANEHGRDRTMRRFAEVVVVAKRGWHVVDTFTTVGTGADGIWADPGRDRLYVALDDSNWIDVYTLGAMPRFIRKIALFPHTGSGPDLGVLVRSRHLLYMPDDSWEEKLDPRTGRIEAKTSIIPYLRPTARHGDPNTRGQIFDARDDTLWVGTNRARIFVFDARNLKEIAHLPAHAGIDQVAYDPAYRLVYAFESDAKGFDVYNAATMQHAAFVSTGYAKTHTGAVDPVNHDLFVYAGAAHAVYVYRPVL